MSKSTKQTQEAAGNWGGYLAKIVEAYLIFIMVVFVMYCKEGYVNYDLNKRNMFYVGSSIFIVVSIIIWLLSLAEAKADAWKNMFGKMDLWLVGILGSWIIGVLTCGDKASAMGGDVYRYIGFVYLGLGIVGMWIISRYAQWDKLLARIMVVVGVVIFAWQNMNCYYIDPLNWTYDGQYHSLMSTLANLNQNACYDAMFVGVGMAMFLLAKKRQDKLVFGIFLFMGFAGGIACTSSTFYMGLLVIYIAAVIYVLRHTEYLWKLWLTLLLFLGADLLHKILYHAIDDERIMLESITALLFDIRVIVGMIGALAITALLIWKASGFFERFGKLLSNLVIVAVVAIVIILIGLVAFANTGHATEGDGSFLSHFVMNDLSGSARWLIWRVTVGMFGQESLFQKLFGIGLNNYSTEIYKYYAADIQTVWADGMVLADAHNVFLDMLASSGLVGVVSYFGITIHVLVKAIRISKRQPVALVIILTVLAWIAVGLLNSNLNVATQVYFGMLGVFWALVRKLDSCEEEKEIIGVV